MLILEWLGEHEGVLWCTSTEFWYDDMESQSDGWLPFLYREFDVNSRGDWHEEGQILDFICSTNCEGRRVLDFGPGDGWPSLRIANAAGEVVGVDASRRRVEECTKNAATLGIRNAGFVCADSAGPLPFESESFDAVVAASSIEQTPDPSKTIREIYRVLKPGGVLRMYYEDLDRYRGSDEIRGRIERLDKRFSSIAIDVREPDRELATMIRLRVRMELPDAAALLSADESGEFDAGIVDRDILGTLDPLVLDVRACRLRHPNGASYVNELLSSGFSNARGTISGGEVAARLFGSAYRTARIDTYEELRSYLRPIVDSVVPLEAPVRLNPWITAAK